MLHLASPKCLAYTLQKPSKDELDRLQEQWLSVPLSVDGTSEWCYSFELRLCLNLNRLNQVLIRPVHRGPATNDTFSKLMHYLTCIDARSGCPNLKLDETSSYVTTGACQFDRHKYARLLFGATSAEDMFQRKGHRSWLAVKKESCKKQRPRNTQTTIKH